MKYADRDECNKKGGDCEDDGFNFSYRYTLNLNTSFTGKDRLYTRLRCGQHEQRLDAITLLSV